MAVVNGTGSSTGTGATTGSAFALRFGTGSSLGTGTTTASGYRVTLATGSSTATGTTTGAAAIFVVYGDSFANLAVEFATASLDVVIDPSALAGGGKVVVPMQTISFDMRQPYLLQGQPHHPAAPTSIATTTTGSGTVIAPVVPEVYTAPTDTQSNPNPIVNPTQRWIVKDSSISGGQNGGVQYNYVTTWTPESGNSAWAFTSPGFPYRPYFGEFQYGASSRPYHIDWTKTLSFAGRYDEFMQLNQTLTQPSTFMMVCWQVKLNGLADWYPIFNRYPINVSPYAFPATVDPDWGYRIFQHRSSQEFVGTNANEFNIGKDFVKEAVYTFSWNGSSSYVRYRDHDRIRTKTVPGATSGGTTGMIIGGSGDVNYFLVVTEVLYWNSALSVSDNDRWERELFQKYDLGKLVKE